MIFSCFRFSPPPGGLFPRGWVISLSSSFSLVRRLTQFLWMLGVFFLSMDSCLVHCLDFSPVLSGLDMFLFFRCSHVIPHLYFIPPTLFLQCGTCTQPPPPSLVLTFLNAKGSRSFYSDYSPDIDLSWNAHKDHFLPFVLYLSPRGFWLVAPPH